MPFTLGSIRGSRLHLLMLIMVVIPSSISMGYNMSFLGGVTGYSSFYKLFPLINTATTKGDIKKHNATVQGAVVSTYNLGALVGCLLCTWFGNVTGRRRMTSLGALVALVGTVLQAAAYQLPQLLIARSELLRNHCPLSIL